MMSVKVRPYRRGGWHVDIRLVLADGKPFRQRTRIQNLSKSAAVRWGQDRERHLLIQGRPQPKKEVPTLSEFAPRFLDGHARANRQKPSGVAAKEMILRVHLIPFLGPKKLEQISSEDVQRLKSRLEKKAAKTVNNVLTVLNMTLKKAVEWNVIERMPCAIGLLPVPKTSVRFYDFVEYERLVTAAALHDPRAHLIVLLGGEAGLRSGEMVALEWRDVDFTTGQIGVERSAWKGHISAPKSGRVRHVPLTRRLAKALQGYRHLRGVRVLQRDDGGPLTEKLVQSLIARAARKANLKNYGPHSLRHTFCSHLAMRGAAARAIQELAGHQDLATTQRYMHLSPAAMEGAIRLLDEPAPAFSRGNIVATAEAVAANASV